MSGVLKPVLIGINSRIHFQLAESSRGQRGKEPFTAVQGVRRGEGRAFWAQRRPIMMWIARARRPLINSAYDEASLDEVVALMDARHIAQLPVVCGGSVVGVVSRVELLAAVVNALDPAVDAGCGRSVERGKAGASQVRSA